MMPNCCTWYTNDVCPSSVPDKYMEFDLNDKGEIGKQHRDFAMLAHYRVHGVGGTTVVVPERR